MGAGCTVGVAAVLGRSFHELMLAPSVYAPTAATATSTVRPIPIAHGRSAARLADRARFLRRDGEPTNACSSSSATDRSDRGEISMACALHGDELPALPHHRKARPSPSEYAQNRHETPTMLRNHHANPPTRTPATARTCTPNPRFVRQSHGRGYSPGKYSLTIPSSCARISSKGRSRSSVVALMRLPLMR